MSVTSILGNVQKTIIKYSPDILAVIAGIGVIGTGILVYDGTVKAQKDMKELKEKNPECTNVDKAVVYAKDFWPAAAMAVTTEMCIFGSNHINKQRIATLAGAYILSETNLREYKDKVEEIVGTKKAQTIQDSMLHDHITQNPRTDSNTCMRPMPHPEETTWWWDDLSKRWFQSSINDIRRAELEANRMLVSEGVVTLNDVYSILGLDETLLAEPYVWRTSRDDGHEILIILGSDLREDEDIICGTINFNLPKLESDISGSWFAHCQEIDDD